MKFLVLTLTMFIGIQQSNAQLYKLKTKKQQLEWTGKAAFKAYSLTGTLDVDKGTLELKNDKIITLEIIVDMKSLDHENSDLKKHLRNEDFFEVNTYKKATYVLAMPTTIKNGKATLKGKMTIKNKTKEETIDATIKKTTNGLTIAFDHEMDRTAYNVKYNSPSFFKSLKQNAIADEFSLKGSINFKIDD